MDIGINKKHTGVMLFLVLGFFVLGSGLVVLAWQNLKQQQEHVLSQLEVTGRAIIRSVEASLYRGIFRGMGPGRWSESGEFTDLARDVLEELVAEGDVVFLDIYSARGRLFISRHQGAAEMFEPDQSMLESAMAGIWTETTEFMGDQVFIMGVPSTRMDMMSRSRRPVPEHSETGQGVIFLALDMGSYLDVYSGFRRNIIFQIIFTLGAVMLFWLLLFAFVHRKEQGRKLMQLRTFHSRLLDNMPDGLLSVDRNQLVTAANPAARNILKTGPEIIGSVLSQIMPVKLDMESGRGWTQVDLEDKTLEILYLPIREESQSLVLIRDRTRMRGLEKDLEHSRDLAALGRFAAALAHEIRNPLSSLRGFAQYFMQKFRQDDPAFSYARTMVMESDRLNRVVTDLLYLARPRSITPAVLNIKEVFQETADLLQSDLDTKKCRLSIDISQETIFADRDLLKQAIINLVLNSLNAVSREQGHISMISGRKGDMVQIVVRDNGHGMDPETREKSAEPFYSAGKQGTGLGLAIVRRIVRDHKGRLIIDSEPGRGTSVYLLFPDNGENIHEGKT